MFSISALQYDNKKEAEERSNVIIRVDPGSGFCEFPLPGDPKKHLLPVLVDPEEDAVGAPERITEEMRGEREFDSQFKDFWMPDRLCKVCYGCEDAFTMYRRKHHCRMCGQIFCNQCSSHYIDGVRACRLCHDQISERSMFERHSLSLVDNTKLLRRRTTGSGNAGHGGGGGDGGGPAAVADTATAPPAADPTDRIRGRTAGRGRGPGPGSSSGGGGRGHSKESSGQYSNPQLADDEDPDKKIHGTNLQNRASAHLEAIVGQLVNNSTYLSDSDGDPDPTRLELAEKWKQTIVGLVREVVSSVDPNVRKGDSLDIRPYVKLKIIPGGTMEESVYVDGVVFRKTVSHKKMMEEVESQISAVGSEGAQKTAQETVSSASVAAPPVSDPYALSSNSSYGYTNRKPRSFYYPVLTALSQEAPPPPNPPAPREKTKSKDPRILLLAGGIDFQRTDTRLSSLDTLVEQEDRYMEILVEKIMFLKPDIILVGKAVARRAQELLCEHKVAVMQNVKPQLLERISRMTGAVMLPSTDHMIQQYGEECLGTCGYFWLRSVQDNPEKIDPSRPQRVLRTPLSRGSTYAYFQGCPPELGCTLVLRGADRDTLAEVKRIIGKTHPLTVSCRVASPANHPIIPQPHHHTH